VTTEQESIEPVANPARPVGPTRDLSEVHIDLFSTGVSRTKHVREEQLENEQDAKERVSMYVRIVDEMLSTVLKSDSYLFTPQELHVLQHFKDLEYGPKYLLTRLLLRKTNKIFSIKELVAKYSTELGEPYIPGFMDKLIQPMDIPGRLLPNDLLPELTLDETAPKAEGEDVSPVFNVNQSLTSRLRSPEKSLPLVVEDTVSTPRKSLDVIELSSDSDAGSSYRRTPVLSVERKRSGSRPHRVNPTPVKTPSKVHPMFAQFATPVRSRNNSLKDSRPAQAAEQKPPSIPKRSPSVTIQKRAGSVDNVEVIEIMSSPPQPIASSSKIRDNPRWSDGRGDRSTSAKAMGKRPVVATSTPSYRGQSNLGPDGKPTAPTEDDLESFYTYQKLSNLTSAICAFARGIEEMSVEEMIAQLTMTDLVKIAKELKLWKSKYTRSEMIGILLASANKQSRLSFAITSETRTRAGVLNNNTKPLEESTDGSQQTTLPFIFTNASNISYGKKNGKLTGRTILHDKVAEANGGKAIQIALPFRSLVHRLNLVYYRSTITPSTGIAKSLMLPEILTTSSKRTYPDVMATRSRVWPNRDALIDYESALEMEAMVDEALGEQNHSTGNWIGQNGYGFGIKGGRLEGARRVKRAWQNVHEGWLRAVRTAEQEVGRSQSGSRHVLDRFELGT
jgi:hypothetical protein